MAYHFKQRTTNEGREFAQRTLNDGAIYPKNTLLRDLLKYYNDTNQYDNLLFMMSPELPYKSTFQESDGIEYEQVSIMYSPDTSERDIEQPALANMSYMKRRVSDSYNSLRFVNQHHRMQHPQISFDQTDEWSLTLILNWDGHGYRRTRLLSASGGTGTFRNQLFLQFNWGTSVSLYNSLGNLGDPIVSFSISRNFIGKNTIVTFTADGTGNVYTYINGELRNTRTSDDTSIFFEWLSTGTYDGYKGYVLYHSIMNNHKTSADIEAEHGLLRNHFTEIPSVKIGNQEWALDDITLVSTPWIQGMGENPYTGFHNLITNGNFNDTSAWELSGNVVIENNAAVVNEPSGSFYIRQTTQASEAHNKVVKFQYTIDNYTSGWVSPYTHNWTTNTLGKQRSENGTFIEYIRTSIRYGGAGSTGTGFIGFLSTNGFVGEIKNVQIETVGWDELQEAYDWFILDGDIESEAIAKCASFCSYNDDSFRNHIFGRLYNYWAVKYIQSGINNYNDWGWRIPTRADYIELVNNITSSSDIKLNEYWESGSANNSLGLSILPTGYRGDYNGETFTDGFFGFGEVWIPHHIDENEDTIRVDTTDTIDTSHKKSVLSGFPIRFIRDI